MDAHFDVTKGVQSTKAVNIASQNFGEMNVPESSPQSMMKENW